MDVKDKSGVALTLRERQIAGLVAQALLNKEIAYRLSLTEGTVKEYLNRLLHKMGMRNRVELAVWVVRQEVRA